MRAATRLLPPLLMLVLAIASGGCGVFAGASPTPTPTRTPTPTATPTTTATPTPTLTPTPEPRVETTVLEVAQGSVGVLRVRGGASSAVATFAGREYPLVAMPGGFWGVIGIAANHPPGSYPVAIALRDSASRVVAELSASLVVVDWPYPVEEISLAPEELALFDPALAAKEHAIRAAVFATSSLERLWAGPFILPVPGSISSTYGVGRSYNGGPVGSFHHGTDFPRDEGTPVVAANSGRVAFAGALPQRGTSVMIDHGAGVFSGYHHLASTTVQEGQPVAMGERIGSVGATGIVTGPHLHWEVVVRGVEVDPVLWTEEDIGP